MKKKPFATTTQPGTAQQVADSIIEIRVYIDRWGIGIRE